MEWIAWIIAGLATTSNIIHAWTGRAKIKKKEAINEAIADATLEQKVDYIATTIGEMKTDVDSYNYNMEKMRERIIKNEKDIQFHDRRISELEKYKILAGG